MELNVGPNVIKPNHEGFTLCKNHFFFKIKKNS